jgi:hypothetical protein
LGDTVAVNTGAGSWDALAIERLTGTLHDGH